MNLQGEYFINYKNAPVVSTIKIIEKRKKVLTNTSRRRAALLIRANCILLVHNENADMGDIRQGDATLLFQNLDFLIPMVYDGIGGSLVDIVNRATDEFSKAPSCQLLE